MDVSLVILGNVLGAAVVLGAITACVRFDQQGKTRRRELVQAERLKALELGRPLDDAAVARYQALGAVGVAVPIASLTAALLGSAFVLALAPDHRLPAWGVVWGVCGAVPLVALPMVVVALRDTGPRQPAPAPSESERRAGPPVPQTGAFTAR